MSIFQALVLGVVQGLTEFLPISSTAHLHLVPRLLGWSDFPFVFDTSLHIGTLLAVLIYFYKDFLALSVRKATFLIAGSVPVMLVGYLFDSLIETKLSSTFYIILFLLAGSLFMFLAELVIRNSAEFDDSLTLKRSLKVGLAQVLALLPGVSRSGVTVSFGIMSGFSREGAARLSFMLSTPAIMAAAGFQLLKSYNSIPDIGFAPFFIGIATSFLVGYVSIDKLLSFLRTKNLMPFIIYRVALVIFLVCYSLLIPLRS